MANKSNIEVILSARDTNLVAGLRKGQAAINAFHKEIGGGNAVLDSMRSNILQLAGAFAGLSAISEVGAMMEQASKNGYALEASIKAANREFSIGSAGDWEQTIGELSEKLKVYSQSDIKGATARTIDMTKRLGMNAEQMKKIIELSGDLAAGRTDLEGGIERVTSALRGEAESAEFLGLTLNETYVTAWYNASAAHEKAWKDLTDLEKAQVRYNVFLEQALPLQGKSAESINTYAGAIAYVKATVSDSISTNEDLVKALSEVGKVLRENAQDIGKFAASIATGAASVIAFVAANREVILEVLKYGVAFGVASKAIGALVVTWKGLNAVMVATMGMQIVPWLRSLEVSSIGATAAITGLKVGFVGLMGATAAFFAAYKAGEWLTMRSSIAGTADAQKQLEKNTGLVAAKFKEISGATGVTITSMGQLDQAVKDGTIHYDQLTGTWKKGSAEQSAASKNTASTVKQVTGEALEAMKKKYEEYAKKIKDIQEEIAKSQRDFSSEISGMQKGGMSGIEAWKASKKEVQDYIAKAKEAEAASKAAFSAGKPDAGNSLYAAALDYAAKAATAAKDLNKEVMGNDKSLDDAAKRAKSYYDQLDNGMKEMRANLENRGYDSSVIDSALVNTKARVDQARTAYEALEAKAKMAGSAIVISDKQALAESVRSLTEVQQVKEQIMRDQAAATAAAAEKLNQQTGGTLLSGLKKDAPEIAAQLEALTTKAEEIKTKIQEAVNAAFVPPDDGDWSKVWEAMETGSGKSSEAVTTQWTRTWDNFLASGSENIDQLESKLQELSKDRYVKIYVEEVQQHATGGLIQRLARGGRLPGYGGGDRISALLEAGEFVIRKEAVSKFGAGLFHALNSLQLPEIPRFATGGPVGFSNGVPVTVGETMTVNLNFGPGRAIPVQTSTTDAARLKKEFARMDRMRSA